MPIPRAAAAVALAVAALGVGWLSVRAALPPALAARPDIAARFAPGDPETMFRAATRAYATTRRTPAVASPDVLRNAARRLPLSADPFVFTAIRALDAGDGARATRLLEEARRRNPRHRLARALLIERYVRENRATEVGVELAALNRLVPDASQIIGESLAELARDPRSTGAVAAALRGDPALDGVLLALVGKGVEPTQILRIARFRENLPAQSASAWRAALLDRMVKAGDVAGAKTLWSAFAGVDLGAGVFNEAFAAHPAPPPFNWAFSTGDVGAAETRPQGGLSVEFYGRSSGQLAGQLVILRPGPYRLNFVAEGNAKGDSSRLVWAVRCAERGKEPAAGRELLNLVIARVTGPPRLLGANFTVPADCPAQWLTLEGLASDFRDKAFVEITDFSMRRVHSAGQP